MWNFPRLLDRLGWSTRVSHRIRRPSRDAHLPSETSPHQPLLLHQRRHHSFSRKMTSESVPLFSYDLLKEITDDFSQERKLGSGGYGSVYKGVHKDGKKIAVKMLYDMPGLDDKQFKKEFNNLSCLQHHNIVQLVGYCHETHEEHVQLHDGTVVLAHRIYRALCFEYMPNGSLHENLFDECSGHDWHTRYGIIKGIWNGLKYLHKERESPMYHLDLKPANILLDENMVPKIADFGLSRLFGQEQTRITKSSIGTWGYLPPEYIKSNLISNKFDIFSLGVVTIKIIAGPKDYSKSADMPSQQFIELVLGKWRDRLQATSVYELDSYYEQVKTCIEIALRCVEAKRHERPSIDDIVDRMNETETKIRLLSSLQGSQKTQITELEEKQATRRLNKAKNLFGEVVDNYKLDQMGMYMGKTKMREDRAREALNLFDEDGKDANASRYLFGPKRILPAARIRSTYCFIYNATGDTIYHVAYHEWSGRGFVASYPAKIGNGQWGAFRHCQGYISGSMAAVVYRGKNKLGEDQDYLLAWSNPCAFGFAYGRNKTYCEIGGVDYFQTRWNDILDKLINSDYSSDAKSDRCEIDSKIGKGDAPLFTARITSLIGHLQLCAMASMDPWLASQYH